MDALCRDHFGLHPGRGADLPGNRIRRGPAKIPPPGRLVDMGGYRLHLNCQGTNLNGGPTVVLEAGAYGNSLTWARIQPELARYGQVCVYDRAGLGWSDSGPGPRTGRQIASELHTLLQKAEIKGPFVLVGHSLGGLYVRL